MGLSVAALSAETITAGPCTSGCSSYHIVPTKFRMRQENFLHWLQIVKKMMTFIFSISLKPILESVETYRRSANRSQQVISFSSQTFEIELQKETLQSSIDLK